MCGRARVASQAATNSVQSLCRSLNSGSSNKDCDVGSNAIVSSENISPGHAIPVVHAIEKETETPQYKVDPITWGLVPSYTKELKPSHYKLFNKRTESFFTKGYYQNLIQIHQKRAVAVLDGFYEWKEVKPKEKKQPYYVHMKDNEPLKLAVICDSWRNSEGVVMETCSILTCNSCPHMNADLHNRTPVMMNDKHVSRWVDPHATLDDLLVLLRELEEYNTGAGVDANLDFYPVSKRMSDPKYQESDCSKEQSLVAVKPVSSFFKPTVKASSLTPSSSSHSHSSSSSSSSVSSEGKTDGTGKRVYVKGEEEGERGEGAGRSIKQQKTWVHSMVTTS
jgi:putative SOS response-associated peptidase YedK